MIFLTFVENAFKYGASSSHYCDILIKLHINNRILLFETQNNIVRHSDEFRKDIPMGIDNCRNRLSGLYPDSYSLTIRDENGLFNVEVRINLNGHE